MSLFEQASLCITPNGTKASKLYAIKPTDASGDLSVTRATTATRVNSDGLIESVANNVPRLDYTNSSCPSILVEPQRTNLFPYSEQFDNAAWTKVSSSVTANSIVAPDGNTTADKLTATATSIPCVYKASSLSGTYTVSSYVKKGTSNYCWLYLHGIPAIFNLDNGTVVSGSNATITSVGNGWYRVTLTGTLSTTDIDCVGVSDGTSIDGITGQYIYIWGAQLEAGSYATSYVPTVASSVTRNADVISKTGISSLIGQTEGTLFVDTNISIRSNTRVLLDVQDGTNNDTFQFVLGGNTLTVNIYDGGNIQASLNGGYCLGRKKIALGYKANDFVLYIDGVQVATDTNGTVPTASLMALGYLYIASGYELGDTINSSALWKTRLSNTELATLTTI